MNGWMDGWMTLAGEEHGNGEQGVVVAGGVVSQGC